MSDTAGLDHQEPSTPTPRRWLAPIVGALLALILGVGISTGLVAIGQRVIPTDDPHLRTKFAQQLPILEGGVATFLGFQRVPVTVEFRSNPDARTQERLDARFVFSPIGGLLLVGLALTIGASVAMRSRGPASFPIVVGMAVLFAAGSFLLALLVRTRALPLEPQTFAQTASTERYRPALFGAFLWPLIWAMVFGTLRIVHRRGDRKPSAPGIRAGMRGLVAGLLFVVLGGASAAGVIMAQHPTETVDILGNSSNVIGITEGIVVGLPHAAAAGVLGSMGVHAKLELREEGKLRWDATMSIFGLTPAEDSGVHWSIPRYARSGLAIAFVMTVLTGFLAARRSGGGRAAAVRSVVTAALFVTLSLWIIAFMAGGGVTIKAFTGDGPPTVTSIGLGFSPLQTIVLPLVWTLVGGAVGGAIGSRLKAASSAP